MRGYPGAAPPPRFDPTNHGTPHLGRRLKLSDRRFSRGQQSAGATRAATLDHSYLGTFVYGYADKAQQKRCTAGMAIECRNPAPVPGALELLQPRGVSANKSLSRDP